MDRAHGARWPLDRCDDRSTETLSPQCDTPGRARESRGMAAARHVGRQPRDRKTRFMPVNLVSLHIVIALGIIALAAWTADGGKSPQVRDSPVEPSCATVRDQEQ